jgi:hypothetical protein
MPLTREDLLNVYAKYTKPPLAIDTTKPLPPESLAEFGIGFTVSAKGNPECPKTLDRVLGKPYQANFGIVTPMSLRELKDQMGISFQIV